MNDEMKINNNIIKTIEEFDNLRDKIIKALDEKRTVNIFIMETEQESIDRRINNLIKTLEAMQEFHNKHYKEFEEKHIRNYLQKMCGYINADLWKEFKKRIGI